MSDTSLTTATAPLSLIASSAPATLGTSIFGGVAIGKDTSGNLKLSVRGLAAQNPNTHRFILVGTTGGEKGPIDVTELILPSADKYIYRLPVTADNVMQGDIIVKSDSPFNVIFVDKVDDGGRAVHGVELITSDRVVYLPPATFFGPRLFVKAVSIFDLFGLHHPGTGTSGTAAGTPMGIDPNFLFLLTMGDTGSTSVGSGGGSGSKNDPLAELLLLQSLAGNRADLSRLIPLLLLRGQGGDSLETILLLQSLQQSGHMPGYTLSSGFGSEQRPTPKRQEPFVQ